MNSISNLFKKGIGKRITSIFSKNKNSKSLNTKGNINLHDALKNTYDNKSNQKKFLSDKGYKYDDELSNHNQQIYMNNNGHMLMSITGTHNLSDLGTDAKLMQGKLKDTKRYKEAEMTFNKAKAKHNAKSTTAIGHSLGGSISSKLNNADEIITLDKGAEFGATTGKREKAYRTSGDIVSMFSSGNTHSKTLHKGNYNLTDPFSWYKAHNVSNIKDYNKKYLKRNKNI